MKFNFFLPESYEKFAASCKHIFTVGDPGVIHFFPKSDCEVRVDQLIQDYTFKFRITKILLSTQIVNEVRNIKPYIHSIIEKKENETIGIFILRSELAVTENSTGFLDGLVKLQNADSTYRFIFITEIDFTSRAVAKLFSSQTSIFSNINYFPLYGKHDSALYLDHLCREWEFTVSGDKKEKILKACGGHAWLLKEALRRVMIEPKTSVDAICSSETMRFRLEQIYFSFAKSEQEVLKKIVKKNYHITDAEEQHSLNYFKKMEFIANNQITVPLIVKYIKSLLPKVNIKLSGSHILVNDLILDSHFSRKEKKVLQLFMKNPDEIVSRDDIAKVIWPINTESYFTEWALDRIIARLRSKLGKLGIPKNFIITLRGRGFMMRNE